MILWTLSFFTIWVAFPEFSPLFEKLKQHFFQSQVLAELKCTISHLRILQECLESGLVPTREDWEEVKQLPAPWGALFYTSLQDLRDRGAPILPSLMRMISSLEEERELQLEAKTKSSQAFGQVLISLGLVPFFAAVLYFLLPSLGKNSGIFLVLVSVCLGLGLIAFFWMLQMMEDARFGKISRLRRSWILSSKIFFERMVADISGGHPPDLAWTRSLEFLQDQEPELIEYWGVHIWKPGQPKRKPIENPMEESVVSFGSEIRMAIQQSITEGRGALERLDSIHRNYLLDLKLKIQRELQVLPNHCLKPLFILVLPSVLLLLFGSMALSFTEMF